MNNLIDKDDLNARLYKDYINTYKEKLIISKLKFIQSHKTSGIVPYLLNLIELNQKSLSKVEKLLYSLPSSQLNSFYGLEVLSDLKKQKLIVKQLHSKAPLFKVKDLNANVVDLKTICDSNKLVLLVFWASWCGPCRNENKELLSMYSKYHNLGFEIIAISCDSKPEPWIGAVTEDGLENWRNVLENQMKYYNSKYTNNGQYLIEYLPTKILVNNKGTIIARYVGAENNEQLENAIRISIFN